MTERKARRFFILMLLGFFALMSFFATRACHAWTRTDTLRVVATGDDGRMNGASFGTTETSNFWGRFSDGNLNSAFFRMQSLIPAGRTITSVTPIPQAYTITGTDTSYIFFSKTNNVAAPTSASEYNAITKTNDSVRWIGGGTWTTGTRYRGPDVTTAFIEQYSLGYCDSGEYVICFFVGRNLANVDAYRRTLDYGFSSGYAFWLEVVHDSPAATSTGKRRRDLLGSREPQFIEWTKWEDFQR